ncbi:protein-glutamate O-methyltransferase CheR [Bowmanella denitrificans]|uniref:CheR family methyltransferase n=1 Tax=Bowmanella denitrificans TaxID=366582 RepID=UPI003182DB96
MLTTSLISKTSDPRCPLIANDLSQHDFRQIARWLYEKTGIYMNDSKQPLVNGRLQKRLRELQLTNLSAYRKRLMADENEQQLAINLLTTNETYFFREPKHFDFISHELLHAEQKQRGWQVWSAAASSGEEAYSIALLMAERYGLASSWQIVGTDINTQVLNTARRGIYPIQAAARIPQNLLKSFCVKGKGKDEGWFMFKPALRDHVTFTRYNLINGPGLGQSFDLILLRNVLIYFELADKQRIVQNVLSNLRPGGWLLVGHSESINGYDPRLQTVRTGCYRFMP